jgi:hypothetical protein
MVQIALATFHHMMAFRSHNPINYRPMAGNQAVNRSTRSGIFQVEAVLARTRLRRSFWQ